ncbi:MAG: SulP family inorganic anion transporter [Candidatus Nitricoxidivorans perseverans]|uniref:SulP family inorganic anion transporter n=1 Tax=Candidatus Nitricoxidivorans perseverans TaxID=2975601 RepID=A0AA49FK53_9PROT|nr:MAG: SulP family inorganic anion transporter [Candidatus Nitricoxidivorans perseverans]
MFANTLLLRLFPFLSWFPINSVVFRGDLMAGIVGALVLVPKAMAYAQLSGLPIYFGLYTAFIPAILGALWGSSRQLLSGPVAIVSLMTAAAVTPLAVPFTEEYIGLALLLTLMVGVIQFGMGAFKLGTIVNFVSHPVILGFINAAAIIIALSQLDMFLGIPKGRSDSFLKDIWEMMGYLPQTHLPTLAMSLLALALMLGLKKIPALAKPSVLITVVITILVSVATGYEKKAKAGPDQIVDPAARELVTGYVEADRRIGELMTEFTAKSTRLRAAEKAHDAHATADLRHDLDLLQIQLKSLEAQNKARKAKINRLHFELVPAAEGGAAQIHVRGAAPAGAQIDGHDWHVKKIEKGEMLLSGGGDVVGSIPAGLPSFRLPTLTWDALLSLLSAAFIVALVAFMETISMAKALAAQTKQRLDPNQELIGQGLSNLGGAFFQAYPSCGSFTGSAINLQAGAKTGLASVFNGVFVAVTLLFLTPYLYHLPKAVLAVIILLAVTSLVTPKAIKHAWKASRVDGIVAVATFAVTLLAAPHLDRGIMVGAGLALVLFLYQTMKPRVAILGRFHDGTLRDAKVHHLPASNVVTAIRFDGRLYFANVSYFEDAVLEAVANNPDAPYVLIVGDGINDIDASGEEVIHHLVERLNESGVVVLFSGLKKQVIDVMQATGLWKMIGEHRFFSTADQALEKVYSRAEYAGEDDPLKPPARSDTFVAASRRHD